ncbi:MAG TPA: M36 family metallopeptidase, partial [Gaiella sp.]|nr:M36 family metallopeptidase [Gaiella sp.]
IRSETGAPAYSPTNTFVYDRHQDQFEQVMAYYWITEAQKYIQSLGFGTTRRPVNKRPQAVRINQWGADNSFATDKQDEIRFGKGGVDDAEDAEVILHEYGHAIHFAQGFQFSTEEAGAISEGFGDYWAVTVTEVVGAGLGVASPDPACVADWDSTSYTSSAPHCLRRLDEGKTYPKDLVGEVHADGEIWSQALWGIRNAIGNVKADTAILEGQFGFDGGTMPALAADIVAAAKSLYGQPTADAVTAAFHARGIL